MTMPDPIDEKLKNACRLLPRHEPGKSLWPGVYAAVSRRGTQRRWPVVAASMAAALATLLILVVATKPRRAAPESGPYYEDATSGPIDVYGESGRRGLPERAMDDAGRNRE
ncbi:MAG: hypothetical protein ACHQ2Z_06400 [Elusimicrobiota bacterium]